MTQTETMKPKTERQGSDGISQVHLELTQRYSCSPHCPRTIAELFGACFPSSTEDAQKEAVQLNRMCEARCEEMGRLLAPSYDGYECSVASGRLDHLTLFWATATETASDRLNTLKLAGRRFFKVKFVEHFDDMGRIGITSVP